MTGPRLPHARLGLVRRPIPAWVAVAIASIACAQGAPSSGDQTVTLGSAASGASDLPEAPVLDTVAALHGALHLFWTNVTRDCDSVEIERKTESAPYGLAFSVPGFNEDHSDDSATDGSTLYTYRLRCKRGGVLSDYSEEQSRTPKPR